MRPEFFGVVHDRGKGLIDFVRGAGHQLAQRSQFFPLHEMGLQALLIFEAAPGLVQQADKSAILQVLADEEKDAKCEHRS